MKFFLKFFILYIINFYLFNYFEYAWHRYGTHENKFFDIIKKTHMIHHDGKNRLALPDYLLSIIPVIIFSVFLYIIYKLKWISKFLLKFLIINIVCFILFSMILHRSYHHNLNSKFSKIFQLMYSKNKYKKIRKSHLSHHDIARKNYGIASNFFDRFYFTLMK